MGIERDRPEGQVADDRWASGTGYEAYMGRWSRAVAGEFVDWLSVPRRARWLDLGCGTGALTETILERREPSAVVGVDPSAAFVDHARASIQDPRVRFAVGTASATGLADESVDAVVAGLVLNFVPDLSAALAEALRVVRAGGIVAGYVWDYAEGMQLLRVFWSTAAALDPAARELDEGVRFGSLAGERLTEAFRSGGLGSVALRAIEVPTRFSGFEDLWAPFLSGTGPAPSYVASLDDAARDALRESMRTSVRTGADGSIRLEARAWAVQGRRPR